MLAFDVMVDGAPAGKASRSQEVSVPVAPGRHIVAAALQSWKSGPREIELEAGAEAVFWILPNPGSVLSKLAHPETFYRFVSDPEAVDDQPPPSPAVRGHLASRIGMGLASIAALLLVASLIFGQMAGGNGDSALGRILHFGWQGSALLGLVLILLGGRSDTSVPFGVEFAAIVLLFGIFGLIVYLIAGELEVWIIGPLAGALIGRWWARWRH